MPRKASGKPWLQNATGWWCATVGGKRVYLAKDYKLAFRKLKILLTRKRQEGTFDRDWLSEFGVTAVMPALSHLRQKVVMAWGYLPFRLLLEYFSEWYSDC